MPCAGWTSSGGGPEQRQASGPSRLVPPHTGYRYRVMPTIDPNPIYTELRRELGGAPDEQELPTTAEDERPED